MMKLNPDLAIEVRARLVLAYPRDPMEDLDAVQTCAVCVGTQQASHIPR